MTPCLSDDWVRATATRLIEMSWRGGCDRVHVEAALREAAQKGYEMQRQADARERCPGDFPSLNFGSFAS